MSIRRDLTVFGAELRRWREHRRYSQEELAARSDVSQRHLSFLENGRTGPSPEMIEHLAITLEMPLRARNGLLVSAGFAPAYSDQPLEGPELARIRRSLELLIEAHDPFPAYVIDKGWNLKLANSAAARLTAKIIDPTHALTLGTNILKMVLHPDGVRDKVVQWEQTAGVLLNRLKAECDQDPADLELRELLEEVLSYDGVSDLPTNIGYPSSSDLITELRLRFDDLELRLYTTIMVLSDASDITVSELRLETLLPADEATERALRELASADD